MVDSPNDTFSKTPRKSGPTNEKPVLTSLSGAGDSNQAGGGQVKRFEKQNERMRRSSRLPLGSVRGKGRLKALPTAAYSHDRLVLPPLLYPLPPRSVYALTVVTMPRSQTSTAATPYGVPPVHPCAWHPARAYNLCRLVDVLDEQNASEHYRCHGRDLDHFRCVILVAKKFVVHIG